MNRRPRLFVLSTLAVVIPFLSGACGKKSPTMAPPPSSVRPGNDAPENLPPAAQPTISISANPSSVQRTMQTTLSWDSKDAASVVIDQGVGNVSLSGSIVVTPLESTTYTAIAKGAGGEARSSARVTVIRPDVTKTDVLTPQQELQRIIDQGGVRPVFFAYDKYDLTEESKEILRENAKVFRSHSEYRVVIEGHCDERGSEEYNLALGDRRAQAAYDYLVLLGVDPRKMSTISFGEERPFDTGTTEAAYARNRRAQFVASR